MNIVYSVPAFIPRSVLQRWLSGLLIVVSQSIYASPSPESVNFSYKDWDLVCDNTRTCRAAGYGTESLRSATVLLTRQAGPSQPVTYRVKLAEYGEDMIDKGTPQLLIGGHSSGTLVYNQEGGYWQMSKTQFTALMKALRQDRKISFIDTSGEYSLSAAGSSAVLLKMDDFQGRVGTTGAIMKKGNNNESAVKMPLPVPVIVQAPVIDKTSRDMTRQEMALIKPSVPIPTDKCDDEHINSTWRIARLTEKQSLIIIPCYIGAYNADSLHFVISNTMASPPVSVTDSANEYSDGIIYFSAKGRGLGDCWSMQQWVWDGQRFNPSHNSNTGRCKGIEAGGAWDLPTLVTNVVID